MNQDLEAGNKNIYKLMFWVLSLSIISISFIAPKFIDYYYTYGIVHKYGVKHFILMQYRWNDGRAISLLSVIREYMILWFPHFIVIAVFGVTLIITAYLVNKLLEVSLQIRFTYFSLITTVLLFFYGFYSHIAHSLFWGVGGGYMFGLFFNCLWFYAFVLLNKDDNLLSLKSLLFILLSGVVGEIGQNHFPAIFIYYLYILIFQKSKHNSYTIIASFIAFAIGAVLISIAHGNTAHASLIFHTTIFSNISQLPLNYFQVLGHYLSISIVLIVLSILLGIYHGLINKEATIKRNIDTHHLVWLLMALATVAPMALIPVAASPRTSIFFQFFLSIFLHNMAFQFTVARNEKLNSTINLNRLLPVLSVVFLFVHSFFIFVQWKFGLVAIKNERDNETAIRQEMSEGKKVVEIKEAITSNNPLAFCINYTADPISKDPTFWVNAQLATYYNVDSVKAR